LGKFSLFCCFWIEMLHRKVETEKQDYKEKALRKPAADSTNLQVTLRTDAGHGKERASL
jgi:uncharacterized caspase-like protein